MRAKRPHHIWLLSCDPVAIAAVIASFSKGNSHNSGTLEFDISRIGLVLLHVERRLFGRFSGSPMQHAGHLRALPWLSGHQSGEIERDL